jgi:hypothetical protein
MPTSLELVRVHVDFNDMDVQGRFFVLLDDASGELHLNTQVTLYDAEGNRAEGTVVELRGDQAAIVEIVAGSWRHAPAPPLSFDELASSLLVTSLRLSSTFTERCRVQRTHSGTVGESASPSTHPQTDGAVLSSL